MAGRLRKTVIITAMVLLAGCRKEETARGPYTMDDVKSWQIHEEVNAENLDTYAEYVEVPYRYTDEAGNEVNSGTRLQAVLKGDYIAASNPVYMDLQITYTRKTEYIDAVTGETVEQLGEETASIAKQIIVGAENANIILETENTGDVQEIEDPVTHQPVQARHHTVSEITDLQVLQVEGTAAVWRIPEEAWEMIDGMRAIAVEGETYSAVLYENGKVSRTDQTTGETKSILTNTVNGSYLDWDLHWAEYGILSGNENGHVHLH